MLNTLAILFILIFEIILWRKAVHLKRDVKDLDETLNELVDKMDELEETIEDTSTDERVERIRNILEAEK